MGPVNSLVRVLLATDVVLFHNSFLARILLKAMKAPNADLKSIECWFEELMNVRTRGHYRDVHILRIAPLQNDDR